MHELGLCSSIVDAIERRAGDRPVAHVRVRVGRLHHVHPEAFDQSFAVAAMGTVAEDADAELVLLPVRARCRLRGRPGSATRSRRPARRAARSTSSCSAATSWCSSRSSTGAEGEHDDVPRDPGPAGGVRRHARAPGPRRRLRGDPDHQHRAARGRAARSSGTGCSSTSASPCRRSTRRRPTLALASLQLMGQAYGDELDAFWSSQDRATRTREVDMGAIIGVLIGYALRHAGREEGWDGAQRDAWKVISTSEEVRDLLRLRLRHGPPARSGEGASCSPARRGGRRPRLRPVA